MTIRLFKIGIATGLVLMFYPYLYYRTSPSGINESMVLIPFNYVLNQDFWG